MKAQENIQPYKGPYTFEKRKRITLMVMRLFQHWKIDTKTQLKLLGLKDSSRAVLALYRKGERAIPDDIDKLDRAGLLLLIHKCLRLLYPENPELVYSWINRKNKKFNNEKPIELILRNGLLGLAKISRYLEFELIR